MDAKEAKKVLALKQFAPEGYESLLAAAVRHAYEAGAVVCAQGEPGAAFYILATGKVQFVRKATDGTTSTVASLAEGEFFGETHLLCAERHQVSAVAETAAELLEVDAKQFGLIVHEHPALMEFLKGPAPNAEEENRILGLLARVPLFENIPLQDLRRILSSAHITTFPKDSLVVREGDIGDAFYVILRGKVKVWVGGDTQPERTLAHLYPGDFFGEMALFSQEPRSASISSVEQSDLLIFTRESFGQLSETFPRLLLYFNKILSKRLRNTLRQQYRGRTPSLLSIYSSDRQSGKSALAALTALELLQQTQSKVLLLDFCAPEESVAALLKLGPAGAQGAAGGDISEEFVRSVTRLHGSGLECIPISEGMMRKIAADRTALERFVGLLRRMYRFILMDLPSDQTPVVVDLLNQSDAIFHLKHEAPPSLPFVPSEKQRVIEISSPVGGKRFRLNEIGRDSFNMPHDAATAHALQENGGYLPAGCTGQPLSKFASRLARCILDRQLGFAFGGGAAWGIAHIGVLSQLEKNGIPIDLIAGTSMGSIAGSIYAARGLAGLHEMAARLNSWPKLMSLLDLSFYASGIVEGTNIKVWLSSIIGGVKLEDLDLPCWVVAADFHNSREVIFKSGDAVEAIRCSISIPGVFVPYQYQGSLFVDGGTVNCVPATAVKEMGADKIVAVNVVPLPSREAEDVMRKLDLPGRGFLDGLTASQSQDKGALGILENATRGLYSLVRGFNVLERTNHVMRSLYMLMHDAAERQSRLADIMIVPDVAGYSWIEFNRWPELIEVGEKAAAAAVPAIKGILQER